MIKKIPYFLALLAFLFLLLSPFFIKVKVECKSQYGSCPPELSSKLSAFSGKTMVSSKRGISKTLKSDFSVSQSSMQFKLPDILQVDVLIKKPTYAIFNKSANKFFLIDAGGTVLAASDKSDLPQIFVDGYDTKPGNKIESHSLFALKIMQGLFAMYQTQKGTVTDNSLVVDMPGSVKVIFPMGDADLDVLLGSFRLIYTKVTTDYQGKYSEIDMRYKNPILRQ